MANESEIHPHGYWLRNYFGELNAATYLSDEWQPLREALAEFFPPGGTINDFGCGGGSYTANLRRHGLDAIGYDGNPCTADYPHCVVADLTDTALQARAADWVLCLEVAEHVPVELEGTLINNIHRHNRQGVVISWAVPGQGGRGHVNERSNEYVRARYHALGYVSDMAAEVKLRAAGVAWFKNTIMVFGREEWNPKMDRT